MKDEKYTCRVMATASQLKIIEKLSGKPATLLTMQEADLLIHDLKEANSGQVYRGG